MDSSRTLRVLRAVLVVAMKSLEEVWQEVELEEHALMEAEAVSVLNCWLKFRAVLLSCW